MNEKLRSKFEDFLAELDSDADIAEYRAAKEAYEGDKYVSTKISEYNVQAQLLEQENHKAEIDTLLIDSLKKRIDELYKEISANEVMKRMTAAEETMSRLFGEINSGLQNIIAPDNSDEGCGGGCSGCSGCH
ncbi:MAG: hypothetical protein A2Y15_01155 [Clostridiales bacterium GWF2_36_10]|nr:MAG: hypothetical protein A2Y15_01155 [Clostridiales bacterium GWF2_36_10]